MLPDAPCAAGSRSFRLLIPAPLVHARDRAGPPASGLHRPAHAEGTGAVSHRAPLHAAALDRETAAVSLRGGGRWERSGRGRVSHSTASGRARRGILLVARHEQTAFHSLERISHWDGIILYLGAHHDRAAPMRAVLAGCGSPGDAFRALRDFSLAQ